MQPCEQLEILSLVDTADHKSAPPVGFRYSTLYSRLVQPSFVSIYVTTRLTRPACWRYGSEAPSSPSWHFILATTLPYSRPKCTRPANHSKMASETVPGVSVQTRERWYGFPSVTVVQFGRGGLTAMYTAGSHDVTQVVWHPQHGLDSCRPGLCSRC